MDTKQIVVVTGPGYQIAIPARSREGRCDTIERAADVLWNILGTPLNPDEASIRQTTYVDYYGQSDKQATEQEVFQLVRMLNGALGDTARFLYLESWTDRTCRVRDNDGREYTPRLTYNRMYEHLNAMIAGVHLVRGGK